jgi:hypothetical protein
MRKDNINIEHLLDRWQVVAAPSSIGALTQIQDVFGLLSAAPAFHLVQQNYIYFRCDYVEIRIEVNGNPFCAGALFAAHAPTISDPDRLIQCLQSHSIVGLQYGMANYNTTSAITLKAHFNTDVDFLPLQYLEAGFFTTNPLGHLLFNKILAPLQRINSAGEPQVMIYVRVHNPIAKIPVSTASLTVAAEGYEQLDVEMVTIGEFMPLPKLTINNDRMLSFKQMAKKASVLCPYGSTNLNVKNVLFLAPSGFDYKRVEYGMGNNSDTQAGQSGIHALLAKIFACYRGGLRYKIRAETVVSETESTDALGTSSLALATSVLKSVLPARVTVLPYADCVNITYNPTTWTNMINRYLYGNVTLGTFPAVKDWINPITLDTTTRNGYIEYEIPYMGNTNWKLYDGAYANSTENGHFIIIQNTNQVPIKVAVQLFMSAADDFRAKTFLGVTRCYLRAETNGLDSQPQLPDYYTYSPPT